MSLEEFISWFYSCFDEKHQSSKGKMRLGQWMMHRLDVRDKYIHKKVSKTECDPFHDDSVIPQLLAEILSKHVYVDKPEKSDIS